MSVNAGERPQHQPIPYTHGQLPPSSRTHEHNSPPPWVQGPQYRRHSTYHASAGADGADHDARWDPREIQGAGQLMKGSRSGYYARQGPPHSPYEGPDASPDHPYPIPRSYTASADSYQRPSDHTAPSRAYSDYSPSFGSARGYHSGRGYYSGPSHWYRGHSQNRGRGAFYRGRKRDHGAYRGTLPEGSGYAGDEDPEETVTHVPERATSASVSANVSAARPGRGAEGDVDLVRCMREGSSCGTPTPSLLSPPPAEAARQNGSAYGDAMARRAALWDDVGKDDPSKWALDDSGGRPAQSAIARGTETREATRDGLGVQGPNGADVLRVKLNGSQATTDHSTRDVENENAAGHGAEDVKAAAATALPLTGSGMAAPVPLGSEVAGDSCISPSRAAGSPTDLTSSTALDPINHFGPNESNNEDTRNQRLDADAMMSPSSLSANSSSTSEQSSPGLSPRSVASSFPPTAYNMSHSSLTSPFSPTPRGAPFGCMGEPAAGRAREARLKILEARVVALAAQLDVVRLEIAEMRMEEDLEEPLIDA
ncbi:hypothetical protein GY45DRAFT_1368795 [Cubamyces sp. BRFM 1775]|nr:hypothetical protein GY45DRAFT_1368795 [Cubamyces sp. BRFM 1775]